MELFADPITVNCRKVVAGLKLLGSDYTLTKVDYFKGEQKSDAFKAINPNAALPALRDGDLVLWESNAILQYAADKGGKNSVLSDGSGQARRREQVAAVGGVDMVPVVLRLSRRELREAPARRRPGSGRVGRRRRAIP